MLWILWYNPCWMACLATEEQCINLLNLWLNCKSKNWIPCTCISALPTPKVMPPERTWQKYLPTLGWVLDIHMYSIELGCELPSDLVIDWPGTDVVQLYSMGTCGVGLIEHLRTTLESITIVPSDVITATWYRFWVAMANENKNSQAVERLWTLHNSYTTVAMIYRR